MVVPFEGLFGDTRELRVIQFLLPSKGLEFNISELARATDVSRPTVKRIAKKFVQWNILKITNKHGNANYYTLDENSGFIEAFEDLNNRIIERMLGEETLEQIANYSIERRIQIQPFDPPVQRME
jgi:DNA-binding transcriptional regulator GbsR (MarR family)